MMGVRSVLMLYEMRKHKAYRFLWFEWFTTSL